MKKKSNALFYLWCMWWEQKLLIMKLSLLLVCVSVLSASASSYSQNTRINLTLKNTTVDKMLKGIQEKTDFVFFYNNETIEKQPLISVNALNETVEQILDRSLSSTDLTYKIDDKIIFIREKETPISPASILNEAPLPQNRQITGKVTEAGGAPMVGVSVYVKNTTFGTTTDVNGNFFLSIPVDAKILVFSFIGFETKEIEIGNQTNISLELKPTQSTLNEVVVIGYGTMKVKDLTGSIARISEVEIAGKNVVSATSLLQGLAAGVQVSGSTGRPGETVKVRVRGATSLTGNNDPLYVIDGVPSANSDIMNSIPPSDIATMDVLKDASATAIYGSRAANGVVMVTTKTGGLNQKAKFSLNYNSSSDAQINNYSILDGNAFSAYLIDLAHKTLVVDPANITAKNILDPNEGYIGTDDTHWFDQVKQNARRQNLDMSISGGSDNIAYFLSGSVVNQKGMVIGDDLSRYSGHLNLDAYITKKFKVGSNITLTYTDQNASGTSLFQAQGYRPDVPVYQEDGVTFYDINPVANSKKINNNNNFRMSGTLYGQLEIIDGLKLKSSISANQNMGYNYTFSQSFLSYYNEASASRTESRGFNSVFDNTLSFARKINTVHAIDAMGGVSFENYESQYSYLSKKGFPMDEIYTNVSGGTDFSQSEDSKVSNGLFSSFARVNYKYDDKYIATLTTRYDGSSMFGKNNRFGFFPSAGLAWRINKENFMKSLTFVNELKFKVSAGKTGIQNLSSYSNRDLYGATGYNGHAGIAHSQIGNNDIRWERSTLYDAGLDFSVFGNRFSGGLVYYLKNTDDLIWSLNFPSSMAVNSMNYNVGSVRNQGVEFNLKAIIIEQNDFKFDLGFNLAYNKNEVTKLDEKGATVNSSGTIVQGTSGQVLAVGYPMGSFFGYLYNGIIQDQAQIDALNAKAIEKGNSSYDGKLYPGNIEFTDLNGDGKIDTKDQTIIGNPDPDFFGGISAMLAYKSFSLMTNFGFQVGGVKDYGKTLQNVPSQLTGLVDYNLYNRWSPDNTGASLPALYLEQGVIRSTKLNLHDASYFRLQDLRLAYDFPKVRQFPLQGQMYVSATNLFTITKYPGTDPATVNNYGNYGGNYETGYPGIRTFSVGLKISL